MSQARQLRRRPLAHRRGGALGLTQRQLAERLDVNESQVSHDERNEYDGVTVDRASRILDALSKFHGGRESPGLPVRSTGRCDRDFQRIGVSPFDFRPSSEKVRARLDMRVTQLMSGGVSVVDPSASLSEVIDLLLEAKIGAVPVVDEDTNQLAGIVSYVDVLRAIREELV